MPILVRQNIRQHVVTGMSWLTKKCGEYTRTLVFFCAALSGVQIPAFIGQFETIVEQRWQEANLALAPFQKDAQRYSEGSLPALIERYRKNTDPAIRDGGESIHQLWQREQQLMQLVEGLSGTLISDIQQIVIYPNRPLLDQTWRAYDFVVPFTITAMVTGLILGFSVMLLADLLLLCLVKLFGRNKLSAQA
jgi:hypothetical protein